MINRTENEITKRWNLFDTPLVSIICITYNHEKYIAEAIESFLLQKTTFPFEILIGEDCSTDKTREILMNYKEKFPTIIKLIFHDTNIGMVQNFSTTFQSCREKYIALCEGDDHWTDPYKLQKQIDFLENNKDFTICCHRSIQFDQNSQQQINLFPDQEEEYTFTIYDLLHSNIANTCSFVYRNMNIKIPDFFNQLSLGDWPLHILHAQFGKIKYFPETMSLYRIHGKSAWSSTTAIKQLSATIDMLKALKRYFHSQYESDLNRSIGNHLLSKAMYYQNIHEHFKTDECLKEASKYIYLPKFIRLKNLIKYVVFKFETSLYKKNSNE